MVKSIVAIDGPRVRFAADALNPSLLLHFPFCSTGLVLLLLVVIVLPVVFPLAYVLGGDGP